MSIKITSRIANFSEPSTFGPTTLHFQDGVAEVDDLSPALRSYLETKGYTVEAVHEGPFDPAKHNATDVLAYLGLAEGHQPPTAEEYDRVVAAERASEKPRAGVLKAIEKAEADHAAAEAKAQEEAAAAQAALDAQQNGGGA